MTLSNNDAKANKVCNPDRINYAFIFYHYEVTDIDTSILLHILEHRDLHIFLGGCLSRKSQDHHCHAQLEN